MGDVPALTVARVRSFLPYLREEGGRLRAAFLLLLFVSLVTVVGAHVPKILGQYLGQGRPDIVVLALVGFLVLTVLSMGAQYGLAVLSARASQGLTRNIRKAIFEKIGRRSGQDMTFESLGALAHRSTGDVMAIQSFFTPGLLQAANAALRLVFVSAALLILDVGTALVALALIAVAWFAMKRANRRVQQLARETQQGSQRIMTLFIDAVGGFRDLVASGRFGEAARAFDERLVELRDIAVRSSRWHFVANMVPSYLLSLFVFAYYLSRLHDAGDLIEFGEVLTFGGMVAMASGCILELSRFRSEASLAAPSFFEVERLLHGPEIEDAGRVTDPEDLGVSFDSVVFSYDGPRGRPVLNGMAFDIEPGSFTAIVGQTGCGKTTIFHLLLRLLEPTRGEIRLGGHPLPAYPLARLRELVGFIPQTPFIFDSTIRENLLLGAGEDVSEERLMDAVRLAQLDGLIERRRREGGLDARVGPGGASLSGGEKQRIALARVFLRDPGVIICDEYTANIDNATARLIQAALAERFKGRTRVVITHQLYTVRGADTILVIQDGRVVDRGTHRELVARPGLFREMWEVQRL